MRRRIVIVVVVVSVITMLFGTIGVSAAGISLRSNGRVEYNNGTDEMADDVIFDASDFDKLYEICK